MISPSSPHDSQTTSIKQRDRAPEKLGYAKALRSVYVSAPLPDSLQALMNELEARETSLARAHS